MEKKFFNPKSLPAYGNQVTPDHPVVSRRILNTPDHVEEHAIDLNEYLVGNKPGTFLMRVNTNSMAGAGIHPGDMVIVDRLMDAVSGKIIIALLDGELLIRRLHIINYKKRLVPETSSLSPIDIDESSAFDIWGVVTFVIHGV